jgi:hypothetical protein
VLEYARVLAMRSPAPYPAALEAALSMFIHSLANDRMTNTGPALTVDVCTATVQALSFGLFQRDMNSNNTAEMPVALPPSSQLATL